MDAHQNEAAAAAAGMQDVYGRPSTEHAVGDRLWFRLGDWPCPRPGRVTDVTALGCYIVDDEDGNTHAVWQEDVAPF